MQGRRGGMESGREKDRIKEQCDYKEYDVGTV